MGKGSRLARASHSVPAEALRLGTPWSEAVEVGPPASLPRHTSVSQIPPQATDRWGGARLATGVRHASGGVP
jgi:hypothetical protein